MRRAPAIVVLLVLVVLIGLGARSLALSGRARLAAWPSAPAVLFLGDPAAPPEGDAMSDAVGDAAGEAAGDATGDTAGNAASGAPAEGEPVQPAHPPRETLPVPDRPRLVMVLVDGLSAADALRLPTLEQLARQGAYYVAKAPEPSWPVSAWATALTARAPEGHGLWLADVPRPLPLPNLPALARSRGLGVAVAGGPGFLQTVEMWVDRGVFTVPVGWEGTGQPLLDAVHGALGTNADLVLIHLEGLHTVAHRLLSGGAPEAAAAMPGDARQPAAPLVQRPVPWDEGLAWTDARLAQILDGIDLEHTTVILAGTYGATASGRHGAGRAVPIAMAGPGVTPSRQDSARLMDLAPTAAALLGLPRALPLDGAPLPAVSPAPADMALPPAPVPLDLPSRLQVLWVEVNSRLIWIGAGLLLAVLYAWALGRQPFGRALLRAVLTYLLVQQVLFLALGGGYTPDLTGLETADRLFWWRRLTEAGGAMGLAALIMGWQLGAHGVLSPVRPQRGADRRAAPERRPARPAYAAMAALQAVVLSALVLGLQVLALLVWTGWEVPRWPGTGWAVKYFLDLSQVMALAVVAPGVAVLSGIGAGVGRLSRGPDREKPAPAWQHPAAGEPVGPGSPGGPIIRLDRRKARDSLRQK